MTNSADPDQLTSADTKWSGSTLFANAGYIRVQQDKGLRESTLNLKAFASLFTKSDYCSKNRCAYLA